MNVDLCVSFDTVNALLLPFKWPERRLVAGPCPDPLEELTALPQIFTWIKGRGQRGRGNGGKGKAMEVGV